MKSGERTLERLLVGMSPILKSGEFVFCTFENSKYGDHQELEPIASFIEDEGLTLVLPKQRADEYGLEYESTFGCITLMVHSSLDAVGLTAAFATRLTELGISANVIAGFFHDHIFVQSDLAEKALEGLKQLTNESGH